MNIGRATFLKAGDSLVVFTLGGADPDSDPTYDASCLWQDAWEARGDMEQAIVRALQHGGGYPQQEGVLLRRSLGWERGLEVFVASRPSAIWLTLTHETWPLLPEVALITASENEATWLDKFAPVCRTLDHVAKPVVQRSSELSLAVVYEQEPGQVFAQLAQNIRRELSGRSLIVDTISGAEFGRNPGRAFASEVINKYRAVIFVGNLHRSEDGANGWNLSADSWLPMHELRKYLLGSADGPLRPHAVGPVPEVVFTSCCCGAWRDREAGPGQHEVSYPKLFLDAGVRFFVGTWMDVWLGPSQHKQESLEVLTKLATGFFARWSQKPDDSVLHLWQAKRDCDFHLLTILHQIYSSAGERPTLGEVRQPVGALVAALAASHRLGDFVLESELWVDQYARTFWATHAAAGTKHLVQVLVDEWQDNPELSERLPSVIEALQEEGLSEDHLIPGSHQQAVWSRGGETQSRRLHVLVYDRPVEEKAEDWSALAADASDNSSPDHFMSVLELGAEASRLLAELHGKEILHGNLEPGSLVLLRRGDAQHLILKDVWVRRAFPTRCTESRYAAPEEIEQDNSTDRLKYDCWGLGIILLELVTGRPTAADPELPSQGLWSLAAGMLAALKPRVPTALARVIQECLMPASALRPSADMVSRRLRLALHAGGTYVSDLEKGLRDYIRAGHRLFGIVADDMPELEELLDAFPTQRDGERYRLFKVAEKLGVYDCQSQHISVRWQTTEEVHAMLIAAYRNLNLPDPGPPSDEYVAARNAVGIFKWAAQSLTVSEGPRPILLIKGADWWNTEPGEARLAIMRILKLWQSRPDSPVTIITDTFIADTFIAIEEELDCSFTGLVFPPPSPAELFERIMAFPDTEGLDVGPVSAQTAIELTERLFPCSNREATDALRVCALQHGVIDERAALIRDERREQIFRRFGTVSFTPDHRLPPLDHVGLPPQVEEAARVWTKSFDAFTQRGGEETRAQRLLLITGPDGCGKTSLALALAKAVKLPVVRVDAARCLHGGLGESEEALRTALLLTRSLNAAFVLLDDIERFFGLDAAGADATSLRATMLRMSGILLDWLDSMPGRFVAAATCAHTERLPPQWRRRFETQLHLPEPAIRDAGGHTDSAHRSAVFAAVFRKCGLEELARDGELLQELARKTDPHTGEAAALRSPDARAAASSTLRRHTVRLETGADIEHWTQQTIYLFGRDSAPASRGFWLDSLK